MFSSSGFSLEEVITVWLRMLHALLIIFPTFLFLYYPSTIHIYFIDITKYNHSINELCLYCVYDFIINK